MQHLFSIEISRNQRPGAELLDVRRAGILSAVEAGEEKTKIAARYRVTYRVIYNIIN
jgi:Mor family transcriptional regulator